ncbi:hypothetical protein [Paraclostridium sordellii]|nr:hypothetical protein [Paeniclostridium sordellii]
MNKLKDENEELFSSLILDMDGAEFIKGLGFTGVYLCQIDIYKPQAYGEKVEFIKGIVKVNNDKNN